MFGLFQKSGNRKSTHTAVARAANIACELLENRTMMSVVIHPVFGGEAQTQDNGTRLSDPPVYLILWGSSWGGTNTAQAQTVENSARAVMNSSFLNGLTQYGVSPHAFLAQTRWDSSNPSNGFSTGDIDNVIQNQIDNFGLPEYDDTSNSGIYVVVTPPGISSGVAGAGGYNTEGWDYDFPFDIDNHIPEIWSGSSNNPDDFSIIFSHELAETMTDEGGNGIEFNPGAAWTGGGHGNQIGDFEPNAYSFREPNGAFVQPLWSRANNAIMVDNGTSQQFDLFPNWTGTSFNGNFNLVVNGDQRASHDDQIFVGKTASGGVSVTLNGETTTFDPGRIAHVQINSGDGNDTIYVNQTLVATNVVSAGNASVYVGGTGGNMQGIVAPLNIENPSNYSNIYLEDWADSGSRFGTLFTRGTNPADSGGSSDVWGEVTGLSPAPVNFEYADTASITINTSGGGGTFNVQNTNVPTNIIGNNDTTINVGSSNTVASIQAPLNIENPGSFNTININDSGDSTARTVVLHTIGTNPADSNGNSDVWGQVTGLGSAAINYEYADTASITVKTGTAANTINVQATGAVTHLVGNSGSGDTVNVPNSTDVAAITGALTIEDPPAFDIVNVNDNSDSTARTVTFHTTAGPDSDNFGTISGLSPADISYEYADVSAVNVTLGVGGDTVNVQDTGTNTNITGGGVLPIIHLVSQTITPIINPNPIPILLVGADNTINVGHSGSTQSINGTLTIDNPYGQNTVNVNDGSDRTGRTVTLDSTTSVPNDSAAYGTINGISPAQIRYEYSDTSAVNFLMGVGGNTVNVHATGCPTSFDGGAVPIIIGLSAATSRINIVPIPLPEVGGPDTYNITDSGSMQRINGALNIENAHGQNTITMDDSADATGRSITLSSFTPAGDTLWQKVQGLAPADVNFENADATANPVTLRAGTGSDTLTVLGASSADAFGLAAGQVTHGGVTVAYSGVENLTLNTGTFNASNDLGALNVSALTSNTSVGFGASQNLASLTVNAASAQLAAGGSKVLSLNALSILGGGKLDLCDNAMQVHYGGGSDPMASIRSWISGGYAGGAFNGAGLCTSSADADHGLGYADSADGVVSGLAANTVLVKYARYGDCNLDGHVDFADLLLQAQNYGKHPGSSTWDQGDCNYDGNVNFADLLKLAQEYGH